MLKFFLKGFPPSHEPTCCLLRLSRVVCTRGGQTRKSHKDENASHQNIFKMCPLSSSKRACRASGLHISLCGVIDSFFPWSCLLRIMSPVYKPLFSLSRTESKSCSLRGCLGASRSTPNVGGRGICPRGLPSMTSALEGGRG